MYVALSGSNEALEGAGDAALGGGVMTTGFSGVAERVNAYARAARISTMRTMKIVFLFMPIRIPDAGEEEK
jgi:hypothetical protein